MYFWTLLLSEFNLKVNILISMVFYSSVLTKNDHTLGWKISANEKASMKYLQIYRTLTTILCENVATPILVKSIDVQLY